MLSKYEINVKEWYKSQYPEDKLGSRIKASLKFDDVIDALNNHKSLYEVIGIGDSVIRERIFKKIESLLNENGTPINYADLVQTYLGYRQQI